MERVPEGESKQSKTHRANNIGRENMHRAFKSSLCYKKKKHENHICWFYSETTHRSVIVQWNSYSCSWDFNVSFDIMDKYESYTVPYNTSIDNIYYAKQQLSSHIFVKHSKSFIFVVVAQTSNLNQSNIIPPCKALLAVMLSDTICLTLDFQIRF